MPQAIAPATGPAVWKGSDFDGNDDWIVRLSSGQLEEIDGALQHVKQESRPVQELTGADFPLPSMRDLFSDLSGELETGRGFAVLRGIPVDSYSEDDLKYISWGLCTQLGSGIPQSHQGDWINHVIDVSDQTSAPKPELDHIIKRKTLRTNHAGGELDFHTDTTDIFALFCLRNAKKGGTSRLVSSAMIHNLILADKPDYAKALYDGYFYKSQTDDNKSQKPRVSANRVPVFTRDGDTVHGYYISQVVQRAIDDGDVTYDPVADDAREEIQRAANAPGVAHEFLLEPGDLLVANNHAVMHAREDYEDHAELDQRRHLFRLWMATTSEMRTGTFSSPSDRFS